MADGADGLFKESSPVVLGQERLNFGRHKAREGIARWRDQ